MHVLDDLSGLSERARDLLRRTGRRQAGTAFRTPTDFHRVTDGRVGVSDGGAFIEVASSVVQLIEGLRRAAVVINGHAVDEFSMGLVL
ncbi:hypothetical protein ACFVH6_42215 [Spirillospora sp. NPDC127200]